jgi:hypothetical protein
MQGLTLPAHILEDRYAETGTICREVGMEGYPCCADPVNVGVGVLSYRGDEQGYAVFHHGFSDTVKMKSSINPNP